MKHSAMPPLPEKMEPYPKPSPLKTPQEVSARIREYISNVRKVLRKDGTTMRLDMTDAMVKRRSDVLLRTLDTVEQRYGDMPGFGTDDPNAVMEDWLYINWLPDTTYNSMELHNHLLYAASMWMLDRIMEKDGAHWDINRWLPRNDHILDGMNVPNTWDCCHEDDLIMSVMWVVCHRNDDAGPEQTDAYRVPYVLAGDLTAEGLQQQDVPSRRNFEGLLKMIPEEYKQRACDHFREAFWKWSDRYFAGLSALHEELPVKRRELNEIIAAFNSAREELRKASFDLRRKKQSSAAKQKENGKPSFNPLLARPQQESDTSRAAELLRQFDTKAAQPLGRGSFPHALTNNVPLEPGFEEIQRITDRMIFLYEKYEKKFDEIDSLVNLILDYKHRMTREGRIRQESCREVFGEKTAMAMTEISIQDPYEMCFALLYLFDQGDDLPWLYGPGTGLMNEVAETLPWGIFDYDELEDDAWYDPDKDEWEQMSLPEPEQVHSRSIPDMYERRFLPKHEDELTMERSLAQIIYEETGCILPRDMHRYDFREKALKRDYGLTAKEAVPLLYVMNALGYVRRRFNALNFREDSMRIWDQEEKEKNGEVQDTADKNQSADESSVTKEDLEEEIHRLQDEVRGLRASLYNAERKTRDMQKERAEEKAAALREHRELSDLRELVFQQASEQPDTEEVPSDDPRFPYEVRQNTVVFGGHDSWVKAIRPMLTGNIRFIDKDLHFDLGVVRHTDMIWIQTNAISHKQYYRIIDTARQLQKPVRYFTSASAEKGALQILDADK